MSVSPTAASPSVTNAIATAARRTGADFAYLVATAGRESGFDPNAQAPTSSAAGLFQFVEQTWLGMVKRHGAAHGLGEMAASIEERGGRFHVADRAAREKILDMRFDPQAAAAMAGEYTAESADILSSRLGREPSGSELYAAHFLGASGAARLIQAAESDPQARADRLFPAAARANRSIFYGDGGARSVSQVLANLGAKHREASSAVADAPADAPRTESERAMAYYSAGRGARISAPARTGARVLSPLVIEALAALETPGRARRKL